MTTLHTSTAAAGLWLALAALFTAATALAQTPPAKPPAKAAAKPVASKTLGGNATSGAKVMTREELRSCLKRIEDLNATAKDLEALRGPLDRERDELKGAGDTLKNERADLDRQLLPIREWETRVKAQTARVEAFNKRNDELAQAPRNQQERLALELKAEREQLEKGREALAAEEARLVPAYRAAAAAHNEKVSARDTRVNDWNARNAAAVEASAKQQEGRTLWLTECANRPYLEDDEKAIKAGK